MNAISTFPFYTLEGWNMNPLTLSDLPLKGNTINILVDPCGVAVNEEMHYLSRIGERWKQ